MKELVDSNKGLLDSSALFNEKMGLITSPIFNVQLNKTEVALANNIEEIQIYYDSLA